MNYLMYSLVDQPTVAVPVPYGETFYAAEWHQVLELEKAGFASREKPAPKTPPKKES